MVSISVPPRIKVLSRKAAIYNIAAEFSQQILRNDSLQETLRKGIVERQLIAAVFFQIRVVETQAICAEFSLRIDWKKHDVALRAGKDEIRVEADKSVAEQITQIATYISSLIEGYRREYGETTVTTSFQYVEALSKTSYSRQRVRAFLGHLRIEETDKVWVDPEGPQRIAKIEVNPKKLNEINLTLRGVANLKD